MFSLQWSFKETAASLVVSCHRQLVCFTASSWSDIFRSFTVTQGCFLTSEMSLFHLFWASSTLCPHLGKVAADYLYLFECLTKCGKILDGRSTQRSLWWGTCSWIKKILNVWVVLIYRNSCSPPSAHFLNRTLGRWTHDYSKTVIVAHTQ